MKIGLVSDIHADAKALRRALLDMPSVDRVLCAGDAISEYRFCAETVTLLQEAGATCIQGNHEWVLFGHSNPHYLRKCREEFTAETLDFLASAPSSLTMEAEGAQLLMVHGSPWEPFADYVVPTSSLLPSFAQLPHDFVILGHTHIPMVHTVGNVTVINPGSCAQPRDQDRRGSYAVLDVAQRTISVHRFRLD